MARATSAAPQGARDPGEAPRHSGRLLLRMPPELHGDLAERAERDGLSLNQLITRLLAEGLAAGDRARGEASRGLRLALALNLALVTVLAVAAIVLVIVALQAT
ncbi:MAG TPA: toxin-antitoxin system HicB family antitoxin [Gaiellaceae bacterium]|nr:toxin-antitoxin system HicB family antitoxin [Gaiellaceae bacterium]